MNRVKAFLVAWVVPGLLFFAPAGLKGQAPALNAQGFRSPKLGPSHQVTGASLAVGHARLVFDGAWAPLECCGQRVGMFLEGSGTLEYSSAFRPEAPVFSGNLKSWSSLETRVGPLGTSVTIPFSSAKLLWVGSALPDWGGPEGEGVQEAWVTFQKKFKVPDVEFSIPQDLAFQGMNCPQAPLAILELSGAHAKWLYRFDGASRMAETLAWLEPVTFPGVADLLTEKPLSRQAIGWDPLKDLAPLQFQIQDLDFDFRTKDNRHAEIIAKEVIYPAIGGLEALHFGLMNTLITEKDMRRLKVSRITDEAGHSLTFDQSEDSLLVRLATRTQAGKAFRLTFEYGGDFLYTPGDDNYWELGVGTEWYPSMPGTATDNFTFHGVVRTLGDWTAFLPGDTVRKGKDGDWNILETRTNNPICWPAIICGKYFVDEETRDGITLRIAAYGSKPGVAKAVLKDQAWAVIQYYQPFLGPFPFKEFSIIEKNEWGYGQAPTGMMFITREAFGQLMYHQQLERRIKIATDVNASHPIPVIGLPSPLAKTMDVRKIFAHEIAHQYWGTVVKMPSLEDQWLTEAFAEYCSSLFLRDRKGKSYYVNAVSTSRSLGASAAPAGPIPLANQVCPKDAYQHFQLRQDLLYEKGPALLASLHEELGEEVFLTWLKSIQSNFRWKLVTTRRTFDLLNFVTKKDFTEFYNHYFWGIEMPTRNLDRRGDGRQ